MRAVDAIQDEINRIPSYKLDLDSSYTFLGFKSQGCNFDTPQYNESSDSYVISTTKGTCAVDCSFMGVRLVVSPYTIEFKAQVTVYSNGDTHVDNFTCELKEEK